jgi:hypothetical protein
VDPKADYFLRNSVHSVRPRYNTIRTTKYDKYDMLPSCVPNIEMRPCAGGCATITSRRMLLLSDMVTCKIHHSITRSPADYSPALVKTSARPTPSIDLQGLQLMIFSFIERTPPDLRSYDEAPHNPAAAWNLDQQLSKQYPNANPFLPSSIIHPQASPET